MPDTDLVCLTLSHINCCVSKTQQKQQRLKLRRAEGRAESTKAMARSVTHHHHDNNNRDLLLLPFIIIILLLLTTTVRITAITIK